jgi:hypothetical protein
MTTGDLPASPAQERRVSPRISIHLDVLLLCTAPDPMYPPFRKVTLKDLSIGGCTFACEQPLPLGTDWLLRFDQSNQEAADTAIRVVRVSPGPDGGWVIGCVFSDIAGLVNAAFLTDEQIAAHASAIHADTPHTPPVHFDAVFKRPSSVDSITALTIHAEKELSITSSATHCTLDIAGPLVASKASILGGRLHIRTTATIGTLGSSEHYLTLVVLGRSFTASLLLAAVPSMLQGPTAELAQRLKTIEHIRSAPSGKLTSAERENLTISISEAREIEKRISRIKANVRSIQDLETKPAAICLEVLQQIHPGVIIAFGDKIARIDQPIKGPATILIDAEGHLVFTTPEMVVPSRLPEAKAAA